DRPHRHAKSVDGNAVHLIKQKSRQTVLVKLNTSQHVDTALQVNTDKKRLKMRQVCGREYHWPVHRRPLRIEYVLPKTLMLNNPADRPAYTVSLL
ncbi:MAG: hypothetical protein AAB318_00690, partial [Planctomycetota bacterium]